ncbi:MAG: hypothetical protein A3J76_03015 [Candidatus Moranbacteria bacterium RBG_13_45_13]|nr:MAG: hypothetical protein A3J76_03015 [Candidatus Moranbacteria bacterium RBG_13_45_13]
MKIYYATKNEGKVMSLRRDLAGCGVEIVQILLDIPEPRSSDVREIALEKIAYAFRNLRKPVVVLDAGFYIHSLNGFPRAYVNFVLETIGLEGILTLAVGKSRECEFRQCLVFKDESMNEPVCFQSCIRGTLATESRGQIQAHHWSPLSLIFMPEGQSKTLAEMSRDEYNQWHWPGRKNSAAKLFTGYLKGRSEEK